MPSDLAPTTTHSDHAGQGGASPPWPADVARVPAGAARHPRSRRGRDPRTGPSGLALPAGGTEVGSCSTRTCSVWSADSVLATWRRCARMGRRTCHPRERRPCATTGISCSPTSTRRRPWPTSRPATRSSNSTSSIRSCARGTAQGPGRGPSGRPHLRRGPSLLPRPKRARAAPDRGHRPDQGRRGGTADLTCLRRWHDRTDDPEPGPASS